MGRRTWGRQVPQTPYPHNNHKYPPSQPMKILTCPLRKLTLRPASSSRLWMLIILPKKKPRMQPITLPKNLPLPPCQNPDLSTIKTLYWAQIISQTVLIRRLGIVLKSNQALLQLPFFFNFQSLVKIYFVVFSNSNLCCDFFCWYSLWTHPLLLSPPYSRPRRCLFIILDPCFVRHKNISHKNLSLNNVLCLKVVFRYFIEPHSGPPLIILISSIRISYLHI